MQDISTDGLYGTWKNPIYSGTAGNKDFKFGVYRSGADGSITAGSRGADCNVGDYGRYQWTGGYGSSRGMLFCGYKWEDGDI